jgi:hypothetical protein
MNEANVQASGRVTASKCGATTFRNNVGGAWSGRKVKTLPNGDIVLRGSRWITFGLTEGSGDTVGWVSKTITPEMVGDQIAQFLSLEYKTKTGRASKKQINWHDVVINAGGLSGFARCDDDVRQIINGVRVDP